MTPSLIEKATIIILTSETYAALARKTCGNFSDGWTYAEIKSCEVRVKYFCGGKDLKYFDEGKV